MSDQIDISREAVDSLAGELILACDKAAQLRTEITATEDDGRHMAVTLLALRAALDAAEAETARAKVIVGVVAALVVFSAFNTAAALILWTGQWAGWW